MGGIQFWIVGVGVSLRHLKSRPLCADIPCEAGVLFFTRVMKLNVLWKAIQLTLKYAFVCGQQILSPSIMKMDTSAVSLHITSTSS